MLTGLAARLPAATPRPKLLVLVLLEQFRGDYLDTAASQLGTGGLRRLLEKGAYFPDCRHLASGFSATAVATLATGAWPALHGIVADSWYDRSSRRAVTASDEMLIAPTLASQVVAADARNRVFVVAMDRSHAGIFTGTPEARVFWMDENGRFTTLGEPPDWLEPFSAQKGPETAHAARWMAVGARADAPALRILTYDDSRPQEFAALYKSSPFAQAAQFDLLSELIAREKLGQSGSVDFVCLLLGATERLGFETGARSVLMQQMTLDLDRRVESLLAQLSHSPGESGFNLVLAAAHGAPPEPPHDVRARMAVSGEPVAQAVEKGLAAAGSGHVEKYLYPFLYLDTLGIRDPEPLRIAAARASMQHPAVAGWFTAGGACSVHNQWELRFRNSFHATRSGDVMLSYRPDYVEDFGQGRGVSYGSLYNYDTSVPLCFYGPQFRAGLFESPVESVDVAPTLARALGVGTPSSSTGRVLGEALLE